MHVVIGLTGMQQGLAFYQLRKLLRVLVIFNSSEVPELLVLYTPQIISNRSKNNRKLFYSSRRSRGHKEH
jgi:hypothetical protein